MLLITENWRKDPLQDACAKNLSDAAEYPVFRKLLLYRHRHIHGYGNMLEEGKLRELAKPVPSVIHDYLQRITESCR